MPDASELAVHDGPGPSRRDLLGVGAAGLVAGSVGLLEFAAAPSAAGRDWDAVLERLFGEKTPSARRLWNVVGPPQSWILGREARGPGLAGAYGAGLVETRAGPLTPVCWRVDGALGEPGAALLLCAGFASPAPLFQAWLRAGPPRPLGRLEVQAFAVGELRIARIVRRAPGGVSVRRLTFSADRAVAVA